MLGGPCRLRGHCLTKLWWPDAPEKFGKTAPTAAPTEGPRHHAQSSPTSSGRVFRGRTARRQPQHGGADRCGQGWGAETPTPTAKTMTLLSPHSRMSASLRHASGFVTQSEPPSVWQPNGVCMVICRQENYPVGLHWSY